MPVCERKGKLLFICEECPAIAVVDFNTEPKNWIGFREQDNGNLCTHTNGRVLCPECVQTHVICDTCGIALSRMGTHTNQHGDDIVDCPDCGCDNNANPVPDINTRTQQTCKTLQERMSA